MTLLSPNQATALDLLRAAGGRLDYQHRLFGFAQAEAMRGESVPMVTAKALVRLGLVRVTRTKRVREQDVPDQVELIEDALP